MRISLLQTTLAWRDPPANRARLAALLAPLAGATDVAVLPETFPTGFDMEGGETAESMGGASCEWLLARARALDAAVVGSVFIRDGDRVYNRLLWATPDGRIVHYDKRHLFRMAGEHQRFSAGADPVIVEWRGARICPLVCYDLRFPVWSRRRAALDYDILVYVANWPARRHYAWQQLLRARAIENQAFVVGVNRVGPDGNGIDYSGGSAVLDALGEPLVELGGLPQSVTVTLDLAAQCELRERFPVERDADPFTLLAGGDCQ